VFESAFAVPVKHFEKQTKTQAWINQTEHEHLSSTFKNAIFW